MPTDIKDYRSLVEKPWGKMFYDQIYQQLGVEEQSGLRILDFGSGFGVSAAHYSEKHRVTAVEPNEEMLALRFPGAYQQCVGGVSALAAFGPEFDLVLCHNVLEYVENQQEIFFALSRVLKPGGRLSIIKHNLAGRVMAAAVFDNRPEKALSLLQDMQGDQSTTFGNRFLYEEKDLFSWADARGLELTSDYGMRAFFALSRDNESKFDPIWYQNMLALETCVSTQEAFRAISFFRHYIFC